MIDSFELRDEDLCRFLEEEGNKEEPKEEEGNTFELRDPKRNPVLVLGFLEEEGNREEPKEKKLG